MIGLVGLSFAGVGGGEMGVDLVLEGFRERAVFEDHVLKFSGEMDLSRRDRGKPVEDLGRKRRGAVLDRAREAIGVAGDLREPREGVEIQRHLGDRPVGKRNPPVGRAGLDADLADPRKVFAVRAEGLPVPVHERPQFFFRAVLSTDLADLPAHRDHDARRLQASHVGGQVGGDLVIGALLLDRGRFREIDGGGGVDVDVVEPRRDRLPDQRA